MTYVTEQTSAELRAHMRRLQAIPGWHNPLDDRLFKEIQALDAEIAALRSTLPPIAITAEEAGREGEAKDAPKARRLVGYGDCRCILSQYCDGTCRPIFEDVPSAPAHSGEEGNG